MRVAVTGRHGQVARALSERAPFADAEIVTLARPEFDLSRPDGILGALKNARADVVVNAAAYTAVDLAEQERDAAYAVNTTGAAAVAEAARVLGLPVIYLSTDYVFDGTLNRPYREDDTPNPINYYGRTKLDGEQAIRTATPDHVIVRTEWIYSPFGKNFVRTMLALAAAKDEIRVVADQSGAPTSAFDIADGILKISRNVLERPHDAQLRGVFHLTALGAASWAQFAEVIFAAAAAAGAASARVIPIPASDYPTPAKRPHNSRLDTGKIVRIHGTVLKDWRDAVAPTVTRLVTEARANGNISGDRT